MQIENGIYKDTVDLSSHEVDPFNATHPTFYFQVMQEVAGAHAYQLGVSIPQLQHMGKTWVVTRTRMRIDGYAPWPGSISVETWPQQPWKLYFPRVCRAWTEGGSLLFESLSQWVVMDLTTQRPIKPQHIAELFGPNIREQLVDPDLGKKVSFPEDPARVLYSYDPRILYTDNDLNMHVNNVVYLQWMLDSLPFSFRDTHVVREVDISYLAQTFREDSVTIRTTSSQEQDMEMMHEVRRALPGGGSQVVSVARTVWQKRNQ